MTETILLAVFFFLLRSCGCCCGLLLLNFQQHTDDHGTGQFNGTGHIVCAEDQTGMYESGPVVESEETVAVITAQKFIDFHQITAEVLGVNAKIGKDAQRNHFIALAIIDFSVFQEFAEIIQVPAFRSCCTLAEGQSVAQRLHGVEIENTRFG